MAQTLKLEIITPDAKIFEGDVDQASICPARKARWAFSRITNRSSPN